MPDVPTELDRIAGTTGRDEGAAAFAYGGSHDLAEALSDRAGAEPPEHMDAVRAANMLAGTTGLDLPDALSRVATSGGYTANYGSRY